MMPAPAELPNPPLAGTTAPPLEAEVRRLTVVLIVLIAIAAAILLPRQARSMDCAYTTDSLTLTPVQTTVDGEPIPDPYGDAEVEERWATAEDTLR